MSDEEILEKLLQFGDYLSVGTIIWNVIRSLLWIFAKGLVWIVDTLENVTDTILGLKAFYQNEEFVDFIETFQPVLVILFALNILYIGYLLIFQKKFNREGVLTNVIMALIIIVLLGSGMQKADRFTTDAIDAIGDVDRSGTMGTEIVTDNIRDVALYDINGWETPEREEKNNIDGEFATDININTPLSEGSDITADQQLSPEGEDILSHKIATLGDGSRKIIELEDGNWIIDTTQEYYYRYTVDWFNMLATLLIMAFVLVTISVKLAKLFFELAFNYALANFVAPADMHSGEKMKQVVQNILNIFIVTILIFLSMKIFMIGTEWIGEEFDGLVYLIAMLGFAMAVIDGPNLVERLFGIDAGMKSGWSAIAGTFALGKGASSVAKGAKGAGQKAKSAAGSGGSKAAGAMGGAAGLASGLTGNAANSNAQGNGAASPQGNKANQGSAANQGENQSEQGKPNGNDGQEGAQEEIGRAHV